MTLDRIQKELKDTLKNLTLYMKKNKIKLEVDYNRSMDSIALKEIDKKVIK
jgi:NTP pyrophosphatase (non-canonical NTP hydrolase)